MSFCEREAVDRPWQDEGGDWELPQMLGSQMEGYLEKGI
jgi:hypothetical protein